MRIEVVGEGTISQQARSYAEYQVFAALTQFSESDKIQRVRVLLRPVKLGSGCDGIVCTVTVKLVGSDTCRIRTTASHAYEAINRTVERIRTDAAVRDGGACPHLSGVGRRTCAIASSDLAEVLRDCEHIGASFSD